MKKFRTALFALVSLLCISGAIAFAGCSESAKLGSVTVNGTDAVLQTDGTYTVEVEYNVAEAEIAVETTGGGTVEGTGTFPLSVGENTFVLTLVSGEDRTEYTVVVTRAANTDVSLASLTVNGTAAVAQPDGTYAAEVAYPTASATLAAIANNAEATVTGTGEQSLKVGENTFVVTVTANGASQNYTVIVTREDSLVKLGSVTVNGTAAVLQTDGTYTVEVEYNVAEAEIAAVPEQRGNTVSIAADGTPVTGVAALQKGENIFSVTVSTPDGVESETYKLVVTRALSPVTDVTSVTVTANGVSATVQYDDDTASFTAEVAWNTAEVAVVLADDAARYELDMIGTLEEGRNTFVLTVIAENGTQKEYTLVLNATFPEFSVTFKGNVEGAVISESFKTKLGETEEIAVSLSAPYTQSLQEITVTYTMGENGPVSARMDEYGFFTIENITGDVVVDVTGIRLNVYTVTFYNGSTAKDTAQITHGEALTVEQLQQALAAVPGERQEAWGWRENTEETIIEDTAFHAIIANAVATEDELYAMEQEGNYYLEKSIEIKEHDKPVVWGEWEEIWWMSPSSPGNPLLGEYRGVFDGKNYTLTYVHDSTVYYDMGILFYRLNGTVRNLKMNITFAEKFQGNGLYGGVALQMVGGCIENVEITADTLDVSGMPLGTGMGVLVGRLFGGTVKNCDMHFVMPTYKFAADKTACIADIQSYEPNGAGNGEAEKIVKDITIYLPSNVEGIAEPKIYLSMGTMAGGYQPQIDEPTVQYTDARDNEIIWETEFIESALGTYTMTDVLSVPRGFTKVSSFYVSEDNVAFVEWQNQQYLSKQNLERFSEVRFMMRWDTLQINFFGWGYALAPNTWYLFTLVRTGETVMTLTITNPGSGEVIDTLTYTKSEDGTQLLVVSANGKIQTGTPVTSTTFNLAAMLTYYYGKPGDVVTNTIYVTELRGVVDESYEYMPGEVIAESALKQGTYTIDKTVLPEGFSTVSSLHIEADNATFNNQGNGYLSSIDLDAYSEVRFMMMWNARQINFYGWGYSLTPSVWYLFTFTHTGDVWTLTIENAQTQEEIDILTFTKTDGDQWNVVSSGNKVQTGSPVSSATFNLEQFFKYYYGGGQVEDTIYVTELRGILATE